MRHLTIPALLATVAVASPLLAQKKAPVKTASSVKSKASTVSAPWRVAFHDATVTVVVDTSKSHKDKDGYYRTHLKWDYTSDQKTESKTYRTLIEDRLLDCVNIQTKPINAAVYDAAGTQVSGFTTPEDELQYSNWSRRKAGSVNAKAFEGACRVLTGGKRAKAASASKAKGKAAAKKKA